MVRKICELQYTKKVFASHFKSVERKLHALAKKKKMGLQKRSQNFACFGRVKKNDFKSAGANPYELGGTSKALGENSMFLALGGVSTQRPNPPPSLAPCPKGCPRGYPRLRRPPRWPRLPACPRHGRRWPGCKSFHVVNHFERKIRNKKTFVKFFFHLFLLSVKLHIRGTALHDLPEVSTAPHAPED